MEEVDDLGNTVPIRVALLRDGEITARGSGMLLGVLVDLCRCFGVFLDKIERETGIIGL